MKNTHRCCFTGHRPEKLMRSRDDIIADLRHEIAQAIEQGITVFITGMSRGVDLWAACIVLEYKAQNEQIKLVCAIPYICFEGTWSAYWQGIYNKVLAASDFTKVFYPSYCYNSFEERNVWMVRHSALVIAVYNGWAGGTQNTIIHAQRQKGTQIRMIKG